MRFLRRLRPFHYGTIRPGITPSPLGLWISNGIEVLNLGQPTETHRPYLNVTLFGRFRGRVYPKELR